jgi:hypothetical protein
MKQKEEYKLKLDIDGDIEGDLFELPREIMLKAFLQRFRFMLTNPLTWLWIIALIILIMQFRLWSNY